MTGDCPHCVPKDSGTLATRRVLDELRRDMERISTKGAIMPRHVRRVADALAVVIAELIVLRDKVP